MSENCYYVEIREHLTSAVVARLGPNRENRAERIEDGISINLDHDKYFTVIVTNETGEFGDEPEN